MRNSKAGKSTRPPVLWVSLQSLLAMPAQLHEWLSPSVSSLSHCMQSMASPFCLMVVPLHAAYASLGVPLTQTGTSHRRFPDLYSRTFVLQLICVFRWATDRPQQVFASCKACTVSHEPVAHGHCIGFASNAALCAAQEKRQQPGLAVITWSDCTSL